MLSVHLEGYLTYTTAHYIFHYREHSLAAHELGDIALTQEDSIARIIKALGVAPDFPLHYIFVDTPEEAGAIYLAAFDMEIGPINGFAAYPDTIVAVYNAEVRCIGAHEDTHLIAHLIGDPQQAFLIEGVAMAMDEVWWGEPNERWVRRFLQDGRYIPVPTLLDNATFYNTPTEITYPIAGAFIQWCATKVPMVQLIQQIYTAERHAEESLPQALGISLAEAETAFEESMIIPKG